jgi:hypothetical protein
MIESKLKQELEDETLMTCADCCRLSADTLGE